MHAAKARSTRNECHPCARSKLSPICPVQQLPTSHAPWVVGKAAKSTLATSASWLPTVNPDTLDGLIRRRYDACTRILLPVAEMLRGRDDVRSCVRSLRSEGFLDWHIFMALWQSIVQRGMSVASSKDSRVKARFQALLAGNDVLSPKDLELWTCDVSELKTRIHILCVQAAMTIGLVVNVSPAPLAAVWQMMSNAYEFDRRDVEHLAIL